MSDNPYEPPKAPILPTPHRPKSVWPTLIAGMVVVLLAVLARGPGSILILLIGLSLVGAAAKKR